MTDPRCLPAAVLALPAQIDMARQAAANGTQLRLMVLSASVLRPLTLVRMDYLLPIHPPLSQPRPAGTRTAHTPSDHGLPEVPEAVNAVPGYPGGAPAAPAEATTSGQAAPGRPHQRGAATSGDLRPR